MEAEEFLCVAVPPIVHHETCWGFVWCYCVRRIRSWSDVIAGPFLCQSHFGNQKGDLHGRVRRGKSLRWWGSEWMRGFPVGYLWERVNDREDFPISSLRNEESEEEVSEDHSYWWSRGVSLGNHMLLLIRKCNRRSSGWSLIDIATPTLVTRQQADWQLMRLTFPRDPRLNQLPRKSLKSCIKSVTQTLQILL